MLRRLPAPVFLLGVFLVAFLLRLGLVLLLRDLAAGPDEQRTPTGDDVEFNYLARALADGRGYVLGGLTGGPDEPTSFRAPGFPFFLAAVYALAGVSYPLATVLFCLLGALACVLCYGLARELAGEDLARLAAVLHAVYLGHAYFAVSFLSENLYVPLLTLGLWLFVRHLKGGSVLWLTLSALALGCAALTRPVGLLLLPLLGLVLLWHEWRQRRWGALPAALFGFGFLACVLPWTYRNSLVHGRPVLIATNGGSTFYGSNNGKVAAWGRHLGYWVSTTELPGRELIEAQPDEVAHDQMEWRLGLQWVRESPGAFALLCPAKVGRMVVALPDFAAGPAWYYAVRAAGYYPFLLLVLVGLWACLRRRGLWSPGWLALHAALLATLAACLVFWGSARFRDANAGVLIVYAAVGVGVLLPRWFPLEPGFSGAGGAGTMAGSGGGT